VLAIGGMLDALGGMLRLAPWPTCSRSAARSSTAGAPSRRARRRRRAPGGCERSPTGLGLAPWPASGPRPPFSDTRLDVEAPARTRARAQLRLDALDRMLQPRRWPNAGCPGRRRAPGGCWRPSRPARGRRRALADVSAAPRARVSQSSDNEHSRTVPDTAGSGVRNPCPK
jgi:hypothetical protein